MMNLSENEKKRLADNVYIHLLAKHPKWSEQRIMREVRRRTGYTLKSYTEYKPYSRCVICVITAGFLCSFLFGIGGLWY